MIASDTVEKELCSTCNKTRFCLVLFHHGHQINLCQRCIADLRRIFHSAYIKVIHAPAEHSDAAKRHKEKQ